jgi:hypothetical protein
MQMDLTADGPGGRGGSAKERREGTLADLLGMLHDGLGSRGRCSVHVEVGDGDAALQDDCGPRDQSRSPDPTARRANARFSDRLEKEDAMHGCGSSSDGRTHGADTVPIDRGSAGLGQNLGLYRGFSPSPWSGRRP